MRVIGGHPETSQVLEAIELVGRRLGVEICWYYRNAFHFRVTSEWTVALTPESAGRYRVQTCHLTRPRATFFTRSDDTQRLARLVDDAVDMVMTMDLVLDDAS